ncbi:hypothetical protein DNK47_01485 [Mycoplasma wenyonii]|uniref:Uncharacterized protein n=1 Tax=Mycoplasma wenyonii TaxID=65123 RepID=A0A328PL80_9MOLU|nr:hypothetical protein [Mycoplasma wenyonii]RAO95144.1 hypothetical protein DNK47_01485 [Mycoplasma wenyonii]
MWDPRTRGKPKIDVTLSWSFILGDNEKSMLNTGKNVSKTTTIDIKRRNAEGDLWPLKQGKANEKLDIIADPTRRDKVVIIKLSEVPSSTGRARVVYSTTGGNGELTCLDKDLNIMTKEQRNIYSRTMRKGAGISYQKNNDGSLKIDVSLSRCEVKEKEVECSLNVVTGSDRKMNSY